MVAVCFAAALRGFIMVFGWGMLLLVAVATSVMSLIPWKSPVDEFEPLALESAPEEEK